MPTSNFVWNLPPRPTINASIFADDEFFVAVSISLHITYNPNTFAPFWNWCHIMAVTDTTTRGYDWQLRRVLPSAALYLNIFIDVISKTINDLKCSCPPNKPGHCLRTRHWRKHFGYESIVYFYTNDTAEIQELTAQTTGQNDVKNGDGRKIYNSIFRSS